MVPPVFNLLLSSCFAFLFSKSRQRATPSFCSPTKHFYYYGLGSNAPHSTLTSLVYSSQYSADSQAAISFVSRMKRLGSLAGFTLLFTDLYWGKQSLLLHSSRSGTREVHKAASFPLPPFYLQTQTCDVSLHKAIPWSEASSRPPAFSSTTITSSLSQLVTQTLSTRPHLRSVSKHKFTPVLSSTHSVSPQYQATVLLTLYAQTCLFPSFSSLRKPSTRGHIS